MNKQAVADDLLFERLLKSAAVLVVDDEPGMRNFLKRALEHRCALLDTAGSAEEAEALRLRYHFDLLLVDVRLPGLTGLDWISKLRERGVRTHVIYMSAYADLGIAIEALQLGADDFIVKPFRTEQMLLSIQRALLRRQIIRENSLLRLQLDQMRSNDGIIGDSIVMQELLRRIQRSALSQSMVLIQGEAGTGKALVARTIHEYSRRSGGFVTVDCSAFDEQALDVELFGIVRHQPVDPFKTQEGLFVHADKGTLFLDKIDYLPEKTQARLAAVVESGQVRPVNGTQYIPVNVRVIGASTSARSSQPDGLAQGDGFRGDLIHRLNVIPLQVPALRERERDIELLVAFFMEQLAAELRLDAVELLHSDWEKLNRYHWPGNVRELRNVVERTVLLGELPLDCLSQNPPAQEESSGYPLDWSLESVERAHIEAVLAAMKNNKSAAARALGVSRKTLERKQALWQRIDASN